MAICSKNQLLLQLNHIQLVNGKKETAAHSKFIYGGDWH